ncbi:MAG: hypothetical protein OWU84_10435 [Firmicutes bacterium]|nr:hypothetical protein [Bacillota bacterium]
MRIRCGGRVQLGFFPCVGGFVGLGVGLQAPALSAAWTPEPSDREAQGLVEALRAAGWRVEGGIRYEVRLKRHVGLGSGTVMALAGAEALCRANGLEPTVAELHRIVRPRARTAVGRTLYEHGGVVWSSPESLERLNWPEQWGLVIAGPREVNEGTTVHGDREAEAIRRLERTVSRALAEEWLAAWRAAWRRLQEGASLDQFLRAFGDAQSVLSAHYATVPGMPPLHPTSRAVMAFWSAAGACPAQSSWGPMVYAIGSARDLTALARATRERFGTDVWVQEAQARNHGRVIEGDGGSLDGTTDGGGR